MSRIKKMTLRIPLVGPLCGSAASWYRAWETRGLSTEQIFTDIFRRNAWGGRDSVSGTGSDLAQTRRIVTALPGLLAQLRVRSLLDLPCGDFHWMRQVDLGGVSYVGADIVRPIIDRNRQFEAPGIAFCPLNLIADPLPRADLVVCRDCLVHLSYQDIFQALQNLGRSGSTYLLTTTFPRQPVNRDIRTGGWRALNLQREPFHLPEPLVVLTEGCSEQPEYADKALGLWRIKDLGI
jgi:hypothetical protein